MKINIVRCARRCAAIILKNNFFILFFYNLYFKIKNKKRFFIEIENRKKLSIFDYKELTFPIPYYPMEVIKDSNFYGQAYVLKKYAHLDKLDFAIEHGLYRGNYIPRATFCKTTKKIITFSEFRKNVIQTRVGKIVIPVGPYIHYAENLLSYSEVQKIKKQYGKILLFFPSHSTSEGLENCDVNTIITVLKKLKIQQHFDTVFVNMYYFDVLNTDFTRSYVEAGFKVVTAGHQLDVHFLSRLRSIIELADYTVSNSMGTHVGYCILLNKPHYIIFGNQETDFSEMKDVEMTFSDFQTCITDEQYAIVAKYWGFDSIKTPQELHKLLSELD